MHRKTMGLTAGLAVTALATAGTVSAVSAASASHEDRARGTSDKQQVIQQMIEAGLQVTKKHTSLPSVKVGGTRVDAANPYLALVPDVSTIDWSYWRTVMANGSNERVRNQAATAIVHEEREPAGSYGANDTQADLEKIRGFGSGGARSPVVRVTGELSPPAVPTVDLTTTEDQGSIPSATPTGIGGDPDAVEVTSRIGDGPHGSNGTESGDFDFFAVPLTAGETVGVSTIGSPLDTIAVLYDAEGDILVANDDADGTYQSKLSYTAPTTGVYYAMISGFAFNAGIPLDPFDSSSGEGYGDEGPYELSIRVGPTDADFYGVHLQPGDVLGGYTAGSASDVVVHKFNGQRRIGSTVDPSSIYPVESPLPGGGRGVFSYVAEREGWYGVSTGTGDGPYRMRLEAYRPGSETAPAKTVQKIFLDFNGARVNTGIWGGPGVRRLSPISDFMADWGLRAGAQDRLVERIVATVRENIKKDLKESGLNDEFRVKVLNSRDDADPFGQPAVSRVVVGGTIQESGIPTIGIAESIDPGNFSHEETALVLLDILSSPNRADDASLNHYLRPSSERVRFIGTAVGNVAAHEVGHLIGSFHVEPFNRHANLMDAGGNYRLLYGVGPDDIGGTADDDDVDFGVDIHSRSEGFTGQQNTYNNSLWAFVRAHN